MIWIANFIIGVCVPEMLIKIGWGTYLFFGFFCASASVFSFFLVPETAKKSLEQIQAAFGDNDPAETQELRRQVEHDIFQGVPPDPHYTARV